MSVTSGVSEPYEWEPSLRNEWTLAAATHADRQEIYRIRHDIYAVELGQHAQCEIEQLTDSLDEFNEYIVAKQRGKIVGFISLTPPEKGGYSIDKYFRRDELPFPCDERTYEVRLLTVIKAKRRRELAPLLMYAALRWVEAHSGDRIAAIGRVELLGMYIRAGLEPTKKRIRSGRLCFELLHATTDRLRQRLGCFHADLIQRLENRIQWKLDFSFRKPAACFHGGSFFDAVGDDFSSLRNSKAVINADVLDAWFDPAPGVVAALREYLPWLLRTSPPTHAGGLITSIAAVRGIPSDSLLVGGGSSSLIFLAFRTWLSPSSRVLILDPCYGEYAHVLSEVIGCHVERMQLSREKDYDVDLRALESALRNNYDWVVLVNPNSPTGRHIAAADLQSVLRNAPPCTRVWLDETYIEYAGRGESLESLAVQSRNIVVCKSMSKVYALSGARVAYLCGPPRLLEGLRAVTPPWAVGLPAQVAAVYALKDPDYYSQKYEETHRNRDALFHAVKRFGWDPVEGIANFFLAHLPADGYDAPTLIERCRQQGLFLRDASRMGTSMGNRAVRVAVKDQKTNLRMARIIEAVQSKSESVFQESC